MYQCLILHYTQQFKCFIYRNLNDGCWSVKALEGPHKGRVVYHAQAVTLSGDSRYVSQDDIEFKVSEAGRQRVLREKRKNVHAGIVGYPYYAVNVTLRYPDAVPAREVFECQDDYDPSRDITDPDHHAYRAVTYNPYKFDRFVFVDDGSDAVITDHWDQSVVMDPDGKVYVMSVEALAQGLRETA